MAALQCLHARDLDRPHIIGQKMICLDDADVADALRIELFDALIDEGEGRNGEDRPPSGVHCVFGDRGGDDGLAKTGWRLDHDAAATALDGTVELVKQLDLLWTEYCAHLPNLSGMARALRITRGSSRTVSLIGVGNLPSATSCAKPRAWGRGALGGRDHAL